MTALSALVDRELEWRCPDAEHPAFALRDGGEEIGWLRFEGGSAARVTAELEGRRWSFERAGSFHPHIAIRAESSGEVVADFTSRLGVRGGVASFVSGPRYAWTKRTFCGGAWCFRSAGEKSAVCVSQKAGPLHCGGKVVVRAGAAQFDETPVLVLLAWYLRLLDFEALERSIVVCG